MNDSLFHNRRFADRVEPESNYDTAQVCLNGHLINSSYEDFPQFNKAFCDTCGSKTIHECPECQTGIQGYLRNSLSLSEKNPPAYCHNCGSEFPWTKERLNAARELLALDSDQFSETERWDLESSLGDLIADSPKTTVAAAKWRKYLAKAGEHTALAFKEIFVQVASETAKKLMFP